MKRPFPRANPSLISLREATFRAGEHEVFPNTRWDLRPGGHWLITGPNGGGKRLFAEVLRGQLPVVRGDRRYGFRAPAGRSPEDLVRLVAFETRKADLGDVLAASRWNLIEEESAATVRELLSYDRLMEINPFEVRPGSDSVRRRRHAARVRRGVELLEIQPFLDRTLLSLSNGETQRVELAKALCRPLKVLILDEPFAGLDATRRIQVSRVLTRLMRSGLALVVMSTRVEEIPRGITHAALIEHNQLVAAGPRARILQSSDLRGSRHPHRRARQESVPAAVKTPKSRPGREVVRFTDLTIRYDGPPVLKGFNWTIRAGESWALVGPNGSGKTTLLSLILGDHPQVYANHVAVLGRRRGTGESVWALKRKIGWVSPDLQLHFDPDITCLEAVGSGFRETVGLFSPMRRSQRQPALAWLRRLGLARLSACRFADVSPGDQRLVLLARAMVKNPALLILDEPCQGLDPHHRRTVVRTIDRLIRTRRVAVIYASHHADEMPAGIQRVMRLGPR